MKPNNHLLIAAAGILTLTTCATHADSPANDRLAITPGTALFSPNELSLDVFGYHASRNKDGADTDAWGPGIGINYYFTENFGFGADTYADAFEVPYLLNGSFLVRYPLWDTGLAPYGYAGFGWQWQHAAQWTGHIGAGLEYRFNPKTGVFVDVREVFAAETADYFMVRFGVRIAF